MSRAVQVTGDLLSKPVLLAALVLLAATVHPSLPGASASPALPAASALLERADRLVQADGNGEA